jgi:2-hydroxychromene-2-carboxylate isomerase
VLVLHFDYPSPAAAVAVLRLQPLLDAGGAVAFAGLDVLGLGEPIPPTLDQLAELAELGARAAALGLELRRPSRRPPTLGAHLVGGLADAAGHGAAWRHGCLRAYWTDDADLGDDAVLVDLAADVGLDPDAAAALLADPRQRLAQRQRDLAARRRGIGGVPVLELDGTFVPADLPDAELRALASL